LYKNDILKYYIIRSLICSKHYIHPFDQSCCLNMLEIKMHIVLANIRKTCFIPLFSLHVVRANVIRDGQIATDAMMSTTSKTKDNNNNKINKVQFGKTAKSNISRESFQMDHWKDRHLRLQIKSKELSYIINQILAAHYESQLYGNWESNIIWKINRHSTSNKYSKWTERREV